MPLYTNVEANPGAGSSFTQNSANIPSMSNGDGSINWGNVIGTGANALVNYFGNSAAANSLQAGEQNAINTQQSIQQQLNSIYQGQRTLGNGADSGLAAALGLNGGTPDYSAFNNSPGFQFSLGLGNQAIQRAASANGSLYTPNELAMLSQYNTGYASQNYNNYIGQLLQSAGLGAQGNAGLGQGITQTGGNISQLQQNQGNAAAGGAANTSGIVSSLLGKVPWQTLYNNITGGGIIGSSGAADAASAAAGWAAPGIDQTGVLAGIDASTGIDTASTASDVAASNADWLSSFSSAGGQAAAGAGSATAGAGAGAAAAGGDVALSNVGTDAATASPTISGLGGSGAAGGTAAGAAGAIGLAALPAILALTVPDSLSSSYYSNMGNILASGPGSSPQQTGAYWGAVLQAQNSGDPRQLAILKQYGIPTSQWGSGPVPTQDQVLQNLQNVTQPGSYGGGKLLGRY